MARLENAKLNCNSSSLAVIQGKEGLSFNFCGYLTI